jgi:hypothetical protein
VFERLSTYSIDLWDSKVDELEKQLQQLRSSIESTRHAQFVSSEAANKPASFTGSTNQAFGPHYSLANQIPVIPHTSRTPIEPHPHDGLPLPSAWYEQPLTKNHRRETSPPDAPVSYFTAPSSSARSLDSITVSQKQIDGLFRMYMNQPDDEDLC